MGRRQRVIHVFEKCLAFSKGRSQASDCATLLAMIAGATGCRATSVAEDKNGNDYVVTLRHGSEILVDAKTRTAGCSRYWRNGEPELALEIWSVCPGGKYEITEGKVGWTRCERKQTDFILFTFDPADCGDVFLISYQLLRIAFIRRGWGWMKQFKVDVQDSGRWQSEAVFVPVGAVQTAVNEAGRGERVIP
jgi:hypothetical protein